MTGFKDFDDGLLKIHHSLKNKIPGCNQGTLNIKPKLNVDENMDSEYQSAFQSRPYQAPQDCLRPLVQRSDILGGLDMQTIYREDFTVHKFLRKAEAKKSKLDPTIAAIDTRTTYDIEYYSKGGDRTMSYKPNTRYKLPTTKFNVRSVYQTSYQKSEKNRKNCRPKVVTHQESLGTNNLCKFEGESTVQSDYKKHSDVMRPQLVKPMEQDRTSGGRFDGLTLYKQCYGGSNNQTSVSAVKAPEKKNSTVEIPMRFDAVSTFMADFKPHYNVARQTSCRPPQSTHHFLDAPFDGRTEKSVAFQEWPVKPPEKPIWALIKEYKRPVLPMMMDSTYMEDFDPPGPNRPIVPVRPGQVNGDIIKHHVGDSEFQWSSRYQTDFKEWVGTDPATDFQIRYQYEPPKEKMLLISTQRAHFKGERAKRAELCRQVSEHRDLNKDGRMQFSTIYKDTYKGMVRPQSCPIKAGAQFITSDILKPHPPTVSNETKEISVKNNTRDGISEFVKTPSKQ